MGWDSYVDAYNRIVEKPWFEDIVGSTIDKDRHSWDFWKNGNNYEPSVEWGKVSVPVLFLFGEHATMNAIERGIDLLHKVSFQSDRERLLAVQRIAGGTHDMFIAPGGGTFDEVEIVKISTYLKEAVAWLEQIGFGGSLQP